MLWKQEGFWLRGPLGSACAVALVAGVFTMALRAVVHPLLSNSLPFVFLFPAVVAVTLRYGVAPALLTLLVGGVWAAVPYVPPTLPPERLVGALVSYVLAGVLTAVVCAVFATPRSSDDHRAQPASEAPLSRWLRSVVWGVAGVSLVALVGVGWWSFEQAFAAGRSEVAHNNEVAAQHAERVFAVARDLSERASHRQRARR